MKQLWFRNQNEIAFPAGQANVKEKHSFTEFDKMKSFKTVNSNDRPQRDVLRLQINYIFHN